ncbi:spermatogenesis associated 6-like protein isoform X2 [Alosa sapidissima]|uniref:spermatogenesis associated 6-like protein isoform X2 n=1 Tax=Alosa sapidissima TaxID=34773 RepID=UPI001C0A5F3F|nr:spermatogenesis associated 6-like protein isoform X2 [Alosa sapidissima]
MSQKAMKVVVELNLRAVTCPGVHLQAKDDVYLSVCLMNQYRQSECLPAVFPLLLREKMRFEKVFWHASDPGALAEVLESEIAKVELIQLTPPVGESLASFVEDARSFLYPEPKLVPPVGGVDRAVLMSRGPAFLGICPQLEFSTRTVISEWSASEETAYNPVPLRVLTQKRGRKRARPGRFSPERLSSSAPWRSGRRRSMDGAPAGTTRARSLSPYNAAALLDTPSHSMHRLPLLRLDTQSPAGSLTESLPESVWQRRVKSWRGDGQSSASLSSPHTSSTSRTGRTRSPSPSPGSSRKPGVCVSVCQGDRPQEVKEEADPVAGFLMKTSANRMRRICLMMALKRTSANQGRGRTGHPHQQSCGVHTGRGRTSTGVCVWKCVRVGLIRSLLCSENVWEDVQTRLRSLLTSPQAMHRLANGATDSEVDEVLCRRSISPHSGGRADQHRPNTEV